MSVILVGASILLSACSGKVVTLAEPNLNIYLLDLTGSGSTNDQLTRIFDNIQEDIAINNLGKPFGDEEGVVAPTVSDVFFVGTNSRYLLNFTLQNFEDIKKLFDLNMQDNNLSNAEENWRVISSVINDVLSKNIYYEKNPILPSECSDIFNRELSDLFSENKRVEYVELVCSIVENSSRQYFKFKEYIELQSRLQTHSDVFGAMSAINDRISQFVSDYPNSNVKVIMASDGWHNISFGNFKDIKDLIASFPDACSAGKAIGNKEQFSSLRLKQVDMSDKPGVGALGSNSSTTAEFANVLSQFWNCFPN